MSGTKGGAVSRALAFFDGGGFAARLASLVAVPSTSQDPGHETDLARYLEAHIRPWLERMGFAAELHENPAPGFGPILLAERIEGAGPTVLTYGHGDTVRGLSDQWRLGLDPWTLVEQDGRWYGRGSADNKGQHALNLSALEAVLAERGGRLGFNLKLILETAEERGSQGLREFVSMHRDRLAADVLIASDGPRMNAATPTVSTGTRGTFHFDLVLDVRPGGVHSGNWGGMTTDPAIVLSHAIASIADRHGRILVRDWLPPAIPDSVRDALRSCELVAEGEAATIDPGWGEPGLTAAEKIYGWNSFIVLALLSGEPGQRRGAQCPRELPNPLHRGQRPRRVRRRAPPPPRRVRLSRGPGRLARGAHGREPHRPGQSLGALGRFQHGGDARPAGAAHSEQRRRPAGRRVHRSPWHAAGLGAA